MTQSQFQKKKIDLSNSLKRKSLESEFKDLEHQIAVHQKKLELLEKQVTVAKRLVRGERGRFQREEWI